VYNSEKHKEFMDSQRYITDDKFLDETESYDLSDGFSVEFINYSDKDKKVVASKIILINANKKIYEYYCFYSHSFVYTKIIHHKNGHRYYPFHVDRYGISFLDVDTLEVYNYIPEGCQHSDDRMCGESFIITDIHYDRESNLIAYGGYYPSDSFEVMVDVMVGDFSEPLNFNPHLVSLRDILDLKWNYDNIGFGEWKNNRLYVLCDRKEEKSLSIDELKKIIKELTVKGK
ncbi:MAG: hypothetical protein K2K14_03885, partial [Ruminococcus sp.]|nr:hypothetical protein [Ruminococcus sp.]